jgi:Ser/Thr protein kinase RdoA (MazF antagonist)
MSDNPKKEPNDVAEELRQLGQNLIEALRGAWDSEERKKLLQEIEAGLGDLGATLSQATQDFSSTPTGQTLKADLNDFQERLRTGEVENKVRSEILNALKAVNRELKRTTQPSPPPDNQNNP